jgi:flagellar hook-associated protein 2
VANTIPGLTGDYTSLFQVGISMDNTGQLSIDDDKLSNALEDNPLNVMKLFIDYGTPTDSSVDYVSKTSATNAGKYSIYIYTPPAQAYYESTEVIGSGGITDDETLTFTYTNEANETVPTVTAFTVNLSSGDTINTVVSKLNSKFSTEEIGLVATNNGGKVRINSTDYGADEKFTLVSNKAAAGQTGVGTTTLSKVGTNVVGTINGHAAYGKGNYLTGAIGFDEEGLKISTTTTTAGGKGYVYVSSGIGAQLSTQLDFITDSDSGTIAYRNDAYQGMVDDIDNQIGNLEERLDNMEERLRKQFVNLEVLLSSLQTQADYMSTQLNNLPKLYMTK